MRTISFPLRFLAAEAVVAAMPARGTTVVLTTHDADPPRESGCAETGNGVLARAVV